MSFSADRVEVQIGAIGVAQTRAEIASVRTEMQAMSAQVAAIKVDTTALRTVSTEAATAQAAVSRLGGTNVAMQVDAAALTTARREATALGTAHQALGGKTVTLGMNAQEIEAARTSVKNLDNDLLSLTSTASRLGPVMAAAFATGALTKFAADYQTLLVTTANNTTMTTDEIKMLDQTIRSLPSGNSPLSDLAAGFKNISDLGFSAAEAQTIATQASKAATETGANQATTMLAVASAMREYGATAQQVGVYTNTIAEAAKLGNSTFNQWVEGTRRATAVASNLNIPLKEVNAALVALTRHGFQVDQAQTQVASLLQHLIAPSQSAQKELARLSKTTGIDLVGDFSLAGVQAKGLSGVLADLSAATRGNESEIYKLIPAVRGGQGALVLAGLAAGDFQTALALLGQTMDGSLTPVEEGFARIQQTAGYQWGTFVKQLKLDAIDVGQAFLPVATTLASVLNAIPAPALKAATDVALFATAIKAASVAGESLTSLGAKLAASLVANSTESAAATVASGREAAAMGEVAAAADVEAASVGRATAANIAYAASATEAEAASTAAGGASTVGLGARALGGTAAGLSAAGSWAVPITVGVIATYALAQGGESLGAWVDRKLSQERLIKHEAQVNVVVKMAYTSDPQQRQAARDYLIKEQVRLQDEIALIEQSGLAKFKSGSAAYARDRSLLANVTTALAASTPEVVDAQVISTLKGQYDALNTAVENGRMTMEQAQTTARLYAERLFFTGASVNALNDSYIAEVDALKKVNAATMVGPKAPTDAEMANLDAHYRMLVQKRDALLKQGAPANLVEESLFPQEFSNLSKAELAAAKKDLASWQTHYKEAQTAFRDAQTELGKVDIGKGLSNLAANAAGLAKVNDELAKVGQSNDALTELAGIADQFKQIAKATDDASVAYDAYTSLLANTDVYEKKLASLKSEMDAGVKAARLAVANGTATPDQVQLLKDAPAIYQNIANSMAQLDAHKAGDLLNIARNVPDWVQADTLTRQTADNLGGIKAVDLRVTADVTAAQDALKKLQEGPYHATVIADVQTQGATVVSGQPVPSSADTRQGNRLAPHIGGGGMVAGGSGLSYADYQKVLASYPGSPIANQSAYNTLMSVASQAGIDPRMLMAVMQTESGYGANAGKIGKQFNYGGMGVNGRGFGFDSGVHATDGGPEYAGYKNYRAFLQDLSAWISQHGTSFSTYQTADQGQAKNNAYQQIVGMTGGGSSSASVANTVGDQIVAKALQSVGQDKLVGYCEQWVEQTVQAITGKRGATNAREVNATTAFKNAQSAGLVTKNPQKGDLVYYPDANGGSGHVAIYMGGGMQVSTWDARPGVNGDQYAVHTESVAAGARYVHVPGVATGGVPPIGTTDYRIAPDVTKQAAAGMETARASLALMANQANVLAGVLRNLTPKNAGELVSFFGRAETAEKAAAEQAVKLQNNVTTLTPELKAQADAMANSRTYDLTILAGRAMADMQNHTGNVTADLQKMADEFGPIGANLAQQVMLWGQIQTAAAAVKADQAAITALSQANTTRKQQEAEADKQASRLRQEDQWARQAAQAAAAETNRLQQQGFADRRITENDAWTVESRHLEDRRRVLQFTQQLHATDLQNRLTDLQKSQQSQVYQRTSQEQLVAAKVRGATTNQEAATLAASLAAMHDADLAQKDANTKAIDDLQMQIREEQKKANLESYNLATETLKETRAHEDRLHRIDSEARAVDRTYQARQRAEAALATQRQIADTRAQWALQDLRQKADEKYTKDKAAAEAQLKSDQVHLDSLKGQQTQAQTLVSFWEKTYQYAGDAANVLLSAFGQITGQPITSVASSPGRRVVRTLGNVPGHAAGTVYSDAGLARVNEQGGELRVLQSGEAIIPADQTRAILRGQGGQGGATFNMPITIGGGISEEQIEEITRQFNAAIRAAVREMRQGNRTAMRALGVA